MSTSDPDRFDWDRYEHEVGSTGQPASAGQPNTDPAPPDAGRVLVDSPAAQRPARGPLREATRRPIVPPWARSRQELAGRTRWAAGLAGHYGAYHATRSPKYAGRLLLRAPRGAGRVLRGLVRWLLDLEGEPVRAAVVRREDAEAYRHLSRQRDRRVRWRALVTTALLVGVLGALAVVALAPPLLRWAAMAILVGVLGVLGAPADRPRRWKLGRSGTHDLFTPVPFGADPRGRGVAVPLVQHNVLIGSLPGQGKTSALRVLACGAALDPTAQLWLHELKGSGDLDPLEQIAHRYVSGIDDDSIGYAADSLGLLKTEVMRRAGALKQLPRQLCPDRRVTRAIADRRQLGLYPLACVIDECQNLFAHPQLGAKAGEDAEFIIKIGRAFGVSLILATRAYKNGLRATVFRPEIDAGIGYLVGATSTPVVVRTAYLDGPATERIAARARALREAAGTLSGHALGQAPQESSARPERLLGDVLGVVPTTQDKVAAEVLHQWLATAHPEVYGDWTTDRLTASLRSYGIDTSVQVHRPGPDGQRRNLRGITRQSVADALTQRGQKPGAD